MLTYSHSTAQPLRGLRLFQCAEKLTPPRPIRYAFTPSPLSAEVAHSGCSAVRLARLVRDQEAGGSNPLTPTILSFEPFGEHVEGLSHCGA